MMDGQRVYGAGRPASAPRRKLGGFTADVRGWSKGRRPAGSSVERSATPSGGSASGPERALTRQASAPLLSAPLGERPNASFDSFQRGSPAHSFNGGYDSAFARNAALRRVASSSGLRQTAPESAYARPGTSSVQRRPRPYEASSAAPSDMLGGGFRPAANGRQDSFNHRAEVLQLESRLTERLREHSMSSMTEPPRREDPRTRGGSKRHGGYSKEESFNRKEESFNRKEESFNRSGYAQMDSRYGTPSTHFNTSGVDLRTGGYGDRRTSAPTLASPYERSHSQPHWRGARDGNTPQSRHYGGSSHGTSPAHGMVGDDGSMLESRLKIYSDLFEEVIERDRTFGSLLRKIKTAYDMLLVNRESEPRGKVPPMPHESPAGSRRGMTSEMMSGLGCGGGHSNEPTTRMDGGGEQAYELQSENRVLKDLVERLHLELEDAVKREHRWKHKVAKLKARADGPGSYGGDGFDPRLPPRAGPPPREGYGYAYDDPSHHMPNAGRPEHNYAGRSANGAMQHHHDRSQPQDYQAQHAHGPPPGGAAMRHGGAGHAGHHAGGSHSFQAMRREPTAADIEGMGHDSDPANRGGLLSLSSISQQTSPQPPAYSFGDGPSHHYGGHRDKHSVHAASAAVGAALAAASDSARSGNTDYDDMHLPQQMTRRRYKLPSSVPPLDFVRLRQHQQEEEERGYQEEPEDEEPEQLEEEEDDDGDEELMACDGAPNGYGYDLAMAMPDGGTYDDRFDDNF